MGITRGEVKYFVYLSKRIRFVGRLATFGRQTVFLSGAEIKAIAHARDALTDAIARLPDGEIDDQQFFMALGFEEVSSIDKTSRDAASIIADLSKPVPDHLKSKFDFVVDVGTMEHVADCLQCFRNASDLLKDDGILVQMLPATNNMDHGYFAFSPCFFLDFFAVNRWEAVDLKIYRYRWGQWRRDYVFYDYVPEYFSSAQWTGRFRDAVGVVSVARKTVGATFEFGEVIQQEFRHVPSSSADGHGDTAFARVRSWGKRHVIGRGAIVDEAASLWHRYATSRALRRTKVGSL